MHYLPTHLGEVHVGVDGLEEVERQLRGGSSAVGGEAQVCICARCHAECVDPCPRPQHCTCPRRPCRWQPASTSQELRHSNLKHLSVRNLHP